MHFLSLTESDLDFFEPDLRYVSFYHLVGISSSLMLVRIRKFWCRLRYVFLNSVTNLELFKQDFHVPLRIRQLIPLKVNINYRFFSMDFNSREAEK